MKGAYGIADGQEVLRRFKFANLPTSDEHADKAKTADFKHLGEIEINLYSCRKAAQIVRTQIASLADGSIPEKALKGRAISNRAALDKAEPAAPSSTWTMEYEGGQRRSFATYIFKYRSRRDLQIEGMIPRSESPVPLEERDPDDLSLEEARELLRRKRARESEKQVKVKKEKRGREAENDDEDGVTITEERSSKRARQSADSGIEIVDLTEEW